MWKSFRSRTELCRDTQNVSGAEWKSWNTEIVGRRGKLSEAAENIGRCGKMSEALECVAGDREDFQKAWVTEQVMSQYVTVVQYKYLL